MKHSEQSARILRAISLLKSRGVDVRQITLCRLFELTQGSMSQIISGKRDFPVRKIPAFCSTFNVNPSFIYTGETPIFGKPLRGSNNDLLELIQQCLSDIDNLKREIKEIKKAEVKPRP